MVGAFSVENTLRVRKAETILEARKGEIEEKSSACRVEGNWDYMVG